MNIDDLKKVNKICAHMQAFGDMDYQTAYSFALAVIQNKEFIRKTLNEGSDDDERFD